MNETCCQVGPERLAGIITAPSGAAPRRGCVLVTAGLVAKSGPFRLYAELARRLAAAGFVTLRFDLGGVGDSAQGYTGLPLRARTALEVAAAVEHLSERFELDSLTLGGLCSGAEDSLRGAAADARVTGVFMIDPFAYRTPDWVWRHTVHRAARRTLRAFGIYEPFAAPALERPAPARPRAVSYKYMERSESGAILAQLLARDTRVHFVYTAGMREAFNHERQLEAAFPELDFRGKVTLDYFRHMDHTQLLAEDRRTLIEAVTQRLAAWPDGPSPLKAPN